MEAYEQVRVIGKGSFGVVTQIVRKSDGKALVWKEVNYGPMSEKEKQLIVSEVNILRELRHPHIVRYLDRVIDKQATKIYIVMEYCEGGDLSQFVKRKKREGSYIEEGFIWHVFTHIYLALRECHRHREGNVVRPILHRDIKPGNIFLDNNGNAKLGDFGLAKELTSESRFAQTNVGTPYYMSPEMVNEMTYDERSDIWALGCLLYEMATLSPPFDATNQLALAKKINAGRFARIPSQYSEGLFQAIRWMLHRQRSRRPRVEDLERIPQLQQRLRAYAATNPALFQNSSSFTSSSAYSPDIQQLQATYNQKMKELLSIEEDLRRQESALAAREKKLEESEADYAQRDAELRKREQLAEAVSRKLQHSSTKESSPTTSDFSDLSDENSMPLSHHTSSNQVVCSPVPGRGQCEMKERSTAANGYNSVKRVPTTFPKGNRDVASSPSIPFPRGSNRRRACSQKTMGFHTPVVHSSPSPSRPVSITSFRLNSPHIMSSSREQVVNLVRGFWRKG